MKRKQFALASVKAAGDGTTGEFEAVLSAPNLDRDNEVIDTGAFEPLPESIPVHAFHDFTNPIGVGTPVYDGDRLTLRGVFASTDRAQEIRTLVTEGVINHMSVGFMQASREVKDGTAHVTKGELLEGSFVSVPSNREAAILAAKEYTAKAGRRNNATDADRLQAIHNLSVENGATCETKADDGDDEPDDEDEDGKSARSGTFKTVAGSYEDRVSRLHAALRLAHDKAWWIDILATFEDAVVYRTDDETYRASYEITDDGITLGAAEPVEVTEVVAGKQLVRTPEDSPDAKASGEPPARDENAMRLDVLAAELALVL